MSEQSLQLPKLAISLVDLERIPTSLIANLLGGRLDLKKIIKVGRDDPSVEFSCPLLEAALVCDMLRSYDRKVGYSPIGIYIYKDSAWRRIHNNSVFTIKVNGKSLLNPQVFSSIVKIASSALVTKSLQSASASQNGEMNHATNTDETTISTKD